MKGFILLNLTLLGLLFVSPAWGGSIGGSSSAGTTALCDQRVQSIMCTRELKEKILDGCYFAEVPNGKQCTWQTCKGLSVVGQLPTYEPIDSKSGYLVEYGVKTPINKDQVRCLKGNSDCFPQYNARMYFTVRAGLDLRQNPTKHPLGKYFAGVDDVLLKGNPYLNCATSQGTDTDASLVKYWRTSSPSKVESIVVTKGKGETACNRLSFLVDDRPTPNNKLVCRVFEDRTGQGPFKDVVIESEGELME